LIRDRDTLPFAIMEEENVWIPMRDGVRLAARIWRPADAVPVPAILEFIPYRKRDAMAVRDERMHPYFAGHGYAAVRVDLRGSGDSEGLLDDEYCPQEQQDGLDVIAWLAGQSWCSGSVGMIGISWGGFNGLQIAAHRPPALKAVVTVASTDDRYADDVHYMGGAQLSANFTWAMTFQADLSRPPDPLVFGEGWRAQWLERLARQTFFIERWLAHPERDAYWKHASVCEDFSRIECAVFAVGGWADSYTNSVGRLLAGLQGPRLGLIGPWAHDYAHTANPGPRIGFLQECLRFWDHWLKGVDSGIMDEPMLRFFIDEDIPVDPSHTMRTGKWAGVEGGGLEQVSEPFLLHPARDGSLRQAPDSGALTCHSPQSLGAASGEWCSWGHNADMPADQSADDGASLSFDTAPLDAAFDLAGATVAELAVTPNGPEGTIVVRLCDVAPDGRSSRVSYGVLDLAFREDGRTMADVQPGRPVTVRLALCDAAHRFAPGHRIRLAVSSAYWPTVWPRPGAAGMSIDLAGSRFVLPRIADDRLSRLRVSFAPAEQTAPDARTVLREGENHRSHERDFVTGRETIRVVNDDGRTRIDAHGLEIERRCEETYEIHPDDPASAHIAVRWRMGLARGEWNVATVIDAAMGWEKGRLVARATITALEGGKPVFSRDYEAVSAR
jgi:putative CocE/NonD family hydrolase